MRHRAELALAAALEIPGIDSKKLAAIGYCFGGTVALELARDGAKLNGVVSLHGGLETPDTSLAKNITAKLLVLHGADDPFVPATEVEAFVQEMQKAKVDFNLIKYPGAVHAFTNKKADDLKLAGAKYNAAADTKSFTDMSAFLAKVFP
jgi:dienelactone hydrolase